MSHMKILIVEDEDLAVKKIRKTLQSVDEQAVIAGVTDSIKSTVEWLEQHSPPDLILMDIELADGQSFEIFKLADIKSPVIFTTSYDEYALKAFKVNSVDYLLKPVQKEELQAALAKFTKIHSTGKPGINIDSLVKHAQKLVSIEVDDIAYFYSDGRLNFFKTTDNRKFVVDYTMDELEEMLDPEKYFRISRSFYVSINSVDKIDDYFG